MTTASQPHERISVFRADALPFARRTHVLIAECEAGAYVVAEVYLLTPGEPLQGMSHAVNRNFANLAHLRSHAERWALQQLDDRLVKWQRRQARGLALELPQLTPVSDMTVTDLWFTGDYDAQLREILGLSRCDVLKAQINTATNLPATARITRTPLPERTAKRRRR